MHRSVRGRLSRSGSAPYLEPEQLEFAHRVLQQRCAPALQRLLHADLHKLNILQRMDGTWVSIDAKGAMGDPCFETWPLITNSLDCDAPVSRIRTRTERLAKETNLEAGRILEWTVAGATLSVVWTLEDRSTHLDHALRKLRLAEEALRTHI